MEVTHYKMRNLARELEELINGPKKDHGFVLFVFTGSEGKFISNMDDDEALKAVSDYLQKSTLSLSFTILRRGSGS